MGDRATGREAAAWAGGFQVWGLWVDSCGGKVLEERMMTMTEEEACATGPALFVNKIRCDVYDSVVRLSFLEETSGMDPSFRCAVVMPRSEAIALLDLLTRMMPDD